MAETYTVEAKLIADINDYSSKLSQAAKQMSGFSNDTEKSNKKAGASFGAIVKGSFVGSAALGVVSSALGVVKNSVGNAVNRFDTLTAYPKIMKQMGFSTQDTNKSIDVLKKGIDGLPTSLQDITKSSQSFATLTGSASSGAKTAIALNDAFIASGAGAADASRGVEQYSQMLASGKVDMVGWRSLQETMPASLNKVAAAFGFAGKTATKDLYGALQSGQITMDQLNNKFIELDGGANGFANTARTASGGIGTSFTNMKNAVTNGLASMLETIDSSLKANGMGGFAKIFDQAKVAIQASFTAINGTIVAVMPTVVGVVQGIVSAIQSAISFIQSNSNWLMPLTVGIASFVGSFQAITGAMSAFSQLNEIGTGLVTTFNALKVAMAANPYVLITAAVIALVAALVYFFTQTETGQKIWATFTDFLKSSWTGMVEFFTGIWDGITAGVTAAAESISSVWNGISSTISSVWNGIASVTSSVWNGISSTISSVWNGIVSYVSNAVNSVKNGIVNTWNALPGIASGIWNGLKSAVSNILSGLIGAVASLGSSILSSLRDAWSGLTGMVSGIWNGLKSVIDGALNIDLGAAGRAIMDGFLKGLKAAWEGVKKFVGGIAGWIRDHKGPISYDRKLLTPAGGAIMGGLNDGLSKGFTGVMSNVSSMAGNIANAVGGSADYRINAVSSGLNIGTDGTLSVDMTQNQQPATINLNMGGSTYRGFVDDISNQQGQTATLNRASIV
nr:MAG TPA: tail tape measure [Caudoviricetes sp.]